MLTYLELPLAPGVEPYPTGLAKRGVEPYPTGLAKRGDADSSWLESDAWPNPLVMASATAEDSAWDIDSAMATKTTNKIYNKSSRFLGLDARKQCGHSHLMPRGRIIT